MNGANRIGPYRAALLVVVSVFGIPTVWAQVNEAWISSYGVFLRQDIFSEGTITADRQGNVVIAGLEPNDLAQGSMASIIHYRPDGTQRWQLHHNESGKGIGRIVLGSGAPGTVYSLVGFGADIGERYGFGVFKYTPEGDVAWHALYEGVDDEGWNFDKIGDISVADDGSVYIGGTLYATDTESNRDFLAVKYSADGALLWARRFNGFDEDNDIWWLGGDKFVDLAVDKDANVVVTGQTRRDEERFFSTVKYDSMGTELWRAISLAGFSAGGPVGVTVASGGCVYVTGEVVDAVPGSDWSLDVMTVKYDGDDGSMLWHRALDGGLVAGGEAGTHEIPVALAADAEGYVYVLAYVESPPKHSLVVKYSPDGDIVWLLDHLTPEINRPDALRLDEQGNLYVVPVE